MFLFEVFFSFFFLRECFCLKLKTNLYGLLEHLELAARKLSDPDVQIKISDTSKVVLEVSKMN